jgi:acid stress-induced BolA-like protein IbaG/YrbA
VHEFPGVGVAGMNRNACKLSDEIDGISEVTKIQSGGDPLRIQIEGQVHNINIACAFSVSKQATIYTLGASE